MQSKKILPSKKFLYLLGSFLVIALVFFLVFKLFSSKNSFFASKNTGKLEVDRLALAGLTVNELIQKDSDSDGIPDWEETLWGTDKNNPMTFDGLTDKAYIAGKKKELNINQTPNDAGLTETDKFAREFFTAYMAMKTAGTVDATTINNFSSALGQNMVNPTLIDRYSAKDIKTSDDNSAGAKTKYYESAKNLFEKYKAIGIGDELSILNNQLTLNQDDSTKLVAIAGAYQDFASSIIKIAVPSDLGDNNLIIANSANNTGVSILNMTKVKSDPLVGLSGLSQYQKYSDELVSAVGDLEAKL